MKWIGQHIWDFISRFRSDVYLEAIESGTIASGGNLGLDSNNKVVKQSDTGITDLHGAGVDGSNNQLLTDDGDGTVTSEANFQFDGSAVGITGSIVVANPVSGGSAAQLISNADVDQIALDIDALNTTAKVVDIAANSLTTGHGIYLNNTDTNTGDSTKSLAYILSTKTGVTGSSDDNDTTGFRSVLVDVATNDANSDVTRTAGLFSSINSSSQGDTTNIGLNAFAAGAASNIGLKINTTDGATSEDIKIVSSVDQADYFSIATGGSGATTIATLDSDATAAHITLNPDGKVILNPISTITEVGDDTNTGHTIRRMTHGDDDGGELTIRAGDSTGTNKDGGDLEFFSGRATGSGTFGDINFYLGSTGGTGDTLRSAALFSKIKGNAATSTDQYWYEKAGASEVDYFKLSVAEHGATTLSTVDGNAAVADLTLSVDGKITMTPADISGDAFHLDANAGADNVVNIDAGILDIDVTGASTLNTTSWTVTSPEVLFTSTTASKPVVEIKNNANDGTGPTLKFNNTHGGNDGADNDYLGTIGFYGNDDGTPTETEFARIYSRIHDATSDEESGRFYIDIANHDGQLGTGFQLTGGSADNEIDVEIGKGTDSVTTIAGVLQGPTDNDFEIKSDGHIRFTVDNDDDESNQQVIFNDGITDNILFNVDRAAQVMTSSTGSHPQLTMINTTDDNAPSMFDFQKNRTDSSIQAGEDGDGISMSSFKSYNDAGTPQSITYAETAAYIVDASDSDEAGGYYMKVACSGGTTSALRNGLTLTGHGTSDTVSADIGYGATSATTIAGDLDIDGDAITSAGALTIQPADVSGVALHIDADADTDNEVQIDAGLLDINVTDDITIDAADNITLTTAGTDGDGRISLISGVASSNTAIHLDGNANAASKVDIDAGVLDIDVEATADILAATSITLQATKHTIDTIYDFHGLTFENGVGGAVDKGTGKIIKYEPNGDTTPNGSEVYYLRDNGAWLQADADGAATSQGLLAVGLGVSSQTGGLLLEGFVRISAAEILNIPGSGAVDGLPVYLSTTAGHFDFNAPSGSGDIVRILGYAIDDDGSPATEVLVYFNPDKTYIEIA